MKTNKFWLVLTEKQAQEKFLTQEYAINDARELAQKRKKPMYLMECVKVFDVDVNVIETSFEATPEESLAVTEQDDIISVKPVLGLPTTDKTETVEPKFKVGDKAQYQFSRYQTGVVTKVGSQYITIEVDGHEAIAETITDDARFFTLL
jgi:hypothetical protein